MKTIAFCPRISTHDINPIECDEESLKNERSIYGGSLEWTMLNADQITRNLTNQLFDNPRFQEDLIPHALLGLHPVIDTRVTLMINENFAPVDLAGEELEMYQAIAGWHCDGVPRKNRSTQPDLSTVDEPVYHYITSLSSTDEQISGTELVDQDFALRIDPEKRVWDQVNSHVKKSEFSTKTCPDGVFTRFNRQTVHQTTPSKVRGWRYFFRCSFYHMPVMNEFRVNNNVYLVPKGW